MICSFRGYTLKYEIYSFRDYKRIIFELSTSRSLSVFFLSQYQRVTSDSSSDQNPHGWHRTTCESSLPTTTRVKSPPSPLTSDGFVAKRLEKIAKEVESIIVSQHFSSFDQEVPTHKHQPHHFHEFMLLTRY
ncbi:unnamed protein product, partial [Brassica oleracea]